MRIPGFNRTVYAYHPVDLISQSLPPEALVYPCLSEPVLGVCCVTGETGPTLPRRALLGESFTGIDLLRAPQSDRIGLPAWRAFTWHERRPGKTRGFHPERSSAWWTDGREIRLLDRVGVRERVFAPLPERPWAAYATLSYKKHGSLFARVNAGVSRLWAWDDQRIDLTDTDRMMMIWERLNLALRQGIGRQAIETLELPAAALRVVGLRNWLAFQTWAQPLYLGPMYRFLAYLLPSLEERK